MRGQLIGIVHYWYRAGIVQLFTIYEPDSFTARADPGGYSLAVKEMAVEF